MLNHVKQMITHIGMTRFIRKSKSCRIAVNVSLLVQKHIFYFQIYGIIFDTDVGEALEFKNLRGDFDGCASDWFQ